jgi:hypothetical protein
MAPSRVAIVTTQVEADIKGLEIGEMVMAAIGDWQQNAPRTKQSTQRILGMSEMGGCREYVRATIAGDPKGPPESLKWAAYLGTAIGDHIEGILGEMGFHTQEDAVVTLPRTGITVRGHLDARTNDGIIDLKTRDGLADVRREGPPFKEKAQISGYFVGKVQEGVVDKNATGHLVYLDRSGKENEPFVWSVTYEVALAILDAVEDRLVDVQTALATKVSQTYLRDEPESWCYAISCPFYAACWEGYVPTNKITHPRALDAVRRLVENRDDEKGAKERREAAREDLRGVEGVTPDGVVVRWTISNTESGGVADRLDVRVPK